MITFLYRIYQILICLPLAILATLATTIVTTIGCTIGSDKYWGYHPGKWWSIVFIRMFLLPVKVEGIEHLDKKQSYVFCCNHQGAFDIFLVYGFLGRNFKWVMKESLRKMPFVGMACEAAGFIFVNNKSTSKTKHMYEKARATLQGGMSLMVFPEGRRTETGKMGPYKRGAFMLADELQLPVVPLTINGAFNVMPRQKDFHWVTWHPLKLTIHKPIFPKSQGTDNLQYLSEESYKATYSALDEEYK